MLWHRAMALCWGAEADSLFFLFIVKASACKAASLEAPLFLLLCAEQIAPSVPAGHVARLLLRSFLVSGEDPMHRAASWPCTSSLPCFAPQSPSSLETSACGGKELGEICFSGMRSLLPLPGIYAIFTCPNSQHHQKLSPHTHQKGFRDLCHAQWALPTPQLLSVACGSSTSSLSHL